MTFDSLLEATEICLKNKQSSRDAIEFKMNMVITLNQMVTKINSREYEMGESYVFITHYPKPREVFAANFRDRILETWIDMRLRPIIEKIISPHVFNNRVGMGTVAAINNVYEDIYNLSEGYKKKVWIIKRDIKAYFPSMKKEIALKKLEDLALKYYKGDDIDDLLYLLRILVCSHPENNCRRVSDIKEWDLIPPEKSLFSCPPDRGLPIGNLLTQMIALLYNSEITDYEYENGLHTSTYVDDTLTVILEEEKEAYLSLIPKFREFYAKLGLKINENKFYCQPSKHGVEFLGSFIHHHRIYLKNKTVEMGYHKIELLNQIKNKYEKIEKFIATINSYLGLLKTRNEYKKTKKLIEKVDPSWYKYCYYDERHTKFCIRNQYKPKSIIMRKYNIKKDDKKRNRKSNYKA